MQILGVIVNIFLPGIGTLIVGRVGTGIIQIILYLVGVVLCFTIIGTVIGIPLCLVVWIWAIVSAATSAPAAKAPASDDVLDYVSRQRAGWRQPVAVLLAVVLLGGLAYLYEKVTTKPSPAASSPQIASAPAPAANAPVPVAAQAPPVATRAETPPAAQPETPKVAAADMPTQRYLGPIPRAGMAADDIIAQAEAFDRWFANPNRPKPTDPMEGLESARQIGEEDKQIRAALRSIPKTSPRYADAQKLIAGYEKQDVETRKQLKVAIAGYQAAVLDARKALAQAIQRNFWESGLDVTTSVSGPNSTVLNLRYVLFSNPSVYKILNADSFTETCKKVGFTKIIFTDGHDKTWTYSLVEKPAAKPAAKAAAPKQRPSSGGAKAMSTPPSE